MAGTDSTVAPQKNQRYSITSVSWLLDKRKYGFKRISPYISFFAEGYRTRTSGWSGAPYLRRYDRELDSKPAIF